MDYKVVPFVASIDRKKDSSAVIAIQLESIIEKHNAQGWIYIRLESVSAFVQPDNGCFGFGAKPGYLSSYQMLIFKKD